MTYLDPSGSQLGHKESVADTAAVLGRMYDAIEFRGNEQADVEALAAHAGVPVYNGLTDEWHPTQMLADFLTMHEASNKPYDRLSYAYVGDCRFNMGRSLLVMGALMGSDVRLAGPRRAAPAQGRRPARRGHRRPHRRPHHGDRRPGGRRRRASTSSTPTSGSRWARPRTSGPTASAAGAVPGERGAAGQDREPGGEVHALPAGLPRHEHGRRRGRSWSTPA